MNRRSLEDIHEEGLEMERLDESRRMDVSSSGTGTCTGTGAEEEAKERDRAIRDKIIKKEEEHVNIARLAVLVAIVACCSLVAVAVFMVAKNNDKRSFEMEYERVVLQIQDMVQWQTQYNFALMQMLSSEITTAALLVNASYPYFTHPQFEVPAGYTDGMGGIMMAAYAPLIDGARKKDWEDYAYEHQAWLNESAKLKQTHAIHRDPLKGTFQSYEGDRRLRHGDKRTSSSVRSLATTFHFDFDDKEEEKKEGMIHTQVWKEGQNFTKIPAPSAPGQKMAPFWQSSPAHAGAVNMDLFSDPRIKSLFQTTMDVRHAVMSPATEIGDLFDWMFDDNEKDRKATPHAFLMDLVYPHFGEDIEDINYQTEDEPVGVVFGLTSYKNYFDRALPDGTDGIVCVLEETCAAPFTYQIFGKKAEFAGYGDQHDPNYAKYRRSTPLELYSDTGACPHTLHIYPSHNFETSYVTDQRWMFAGVVVVAFAVTAMILLAYDITVTRRQNKTMKTAIKTEIFVASLFPQGVRDRLMEDALQRDNDGDGKNGKKKAFQNAFLAKQANEKVSNGSSSLPIADFFPEATLLFMDISGFTAWSSTREPFQVFELLEALFTSFDKLAVRRRVFKVETVGDQYVASAGVPTPRTDHASTMCRFAADCMKEAQQIFRRLEVKLGPDTSDLAFRAGLHSGPVTGGVLRGQNARFQLFGDTMNTASRMESCGERHRIQLSAATAEILESRGKGHWLREREGGVEAKGKGVMRTFWLEIKSSGSVGGSSATGSSEALTEPLFSDDDEKPADTLSSIRKPYAKMDRLIDWNTEILSGLLRQVVARRQALAAQSSTSTAAIVPSTHATILTGNRTPFEEVKEIIALPAFVPNLDSQNPDAIDLGEKVSQQLRAYVALIAGLYQDNAFHNFEHAAHVTMSTSKLLSRIVAPKKLEDRNISLHDHTYGITSDPLTQFSVVMSALIHDVDHQGVPNGQLIKEQQPIATKYHGRSVAEQNSVDLAWDLLMREEYKDLCHAIYATPSEQQRFRQLVVNSVMATDIMDRELKKARNVRWTRAFEGGAGSGTGQPHQQPEENPLDTVNRKATIVIEHLIQASDVSHSMQHWHIYRKWNERLFMELNTAYLEGRAEKDPSIYWYQGELGFFDYYIIPLAKKLKECGVFGVSSDEYLSYAQHNRSEWERHGKAEVAEMVAKFQSRKQNTATHDERTKQVQQRKAAAVELSQRMLEQTDSSESSTDMDEEGEDHQQLVKPGPDGDAALLHQLDNLESEMLRTCEEGQAHLSSDTVKIAL